MSNIIDTIQVSGVTYTIAGSGSGNSVVEVTQAQYDAMVSGGTVDPTILYIITDAQAGDLTNYYTKTETNTLLNGKQATLVSGTNIKTINNESLLGSGNIDIQGGGVDVVQTTGTSTTDVMSQDAVTTQLNGKQDSSKLPTYIVDNVNFSGNKVTVGKINKANGGGFSISNNVITINNQAIFNNSNLSNLSLVETSAITTSISSASTDVQVPSAKAVYESVSGKVDTSSMSGYVTTDTAQEITGEKTFVGEKKLKIKQSGNSSKIGFTLYNSASTNNELATFEFRPNTYTVSNVNHPLLYLGHYRTTNIANAGVPQTVIGFRQYDQANSAAYHLFAPLPEEAKTPFSLTTSFQNYFMPLGFKNGSTMIKTDNTGVVDFSNVLGGLKLVKLTQTEYDNLSTKDSNTLYVIVN